MRPGQVKYPKGVASTDPHLLLFITSYRCHQIVTPKGVNPFVPVSGYLAVSGSILTDTPEGVLH